MRTCDEVWPSRARWLIAVFVLADETDVDDSKAGIVEDAIDNRIEGVG